MPPAPWLHLRSACAESGRAPRVLRRDHGTSSTSLELRPLECPSSVTPRCCPLPRHRMNPLPLRAETTAGLDISFHPRGFSPPRRFPPASRLQACCILVPEGVRRVSLEAPTTESEDSVDRRPGPRDARTLRRKLPRTAARRASLRSACPLAVPPEPGRHGTNPTPPSRARTDRPPPPKRCLPLDPTDETWYLPEPHFLGPARRDGPRNAPRLSKKHPPCLSATAQARSRPRHGPLEPSVHCGVSTGLPLPSRAP
jgi:hypothetical protein